MSAELFRQTAGIEMLHVPFRTSSEAIAAVLGKQVDILFDTVLPVTGPVQSGQLKAIAVTGKDRYAALPDVPPAIESGMLPGYNVTTWYGLFAPSGTPPHVVAKLHKAVSESIKDEAVRDRLIKAGVAVQGSTPEEFGKFMAVELARWNKVREAAGIAQQ
jgi:tripartite-type tricarboxylate transporter receptor subunit TctC